jgi:DNA-binding MarR family transcriptional regulator
MDQRLDELTAQVSDLLPLLATKLIRFVKDLPDKDLTIAQAFLLHNLRAHGPSTASEISDMMCVTSGPVTNLTKRLIARGFVERHQDDTDKRVMWFSLTQEGEQLAQSLAAYSHSRWRLIGEELGVEKVSSAVDLMREAIQILNRIK